MRRTKVIAILVLTLAATTARAGVYADGLGKCLVGKTTAADQTTLMRWMLSAFLASPSVQSMVPTARVDHERYNRDAAQLTDRLLLHDCRPETVEAIKYEGLQAVQAAFAILGQVAARSFASDAEVQKQFAQLGTFMDKDGVKALGKEAGVATDGVPSGK